MPINRLSEWLCRPAQYSPQLLPDCFVAIAPRNDEQGCHSYETCACESRNLPGGGVERSFGRLHSLKDDKVMHALRNDW